MAAHTCDVLCTGLIVADHVAAPVRAMPPSGGLASTPQTELTIGGCGANVAVDLAKLDLSTQLVGCVGDDVLGRYVRDELDCAGVGCDGLIVSKTAQTATTLVVNVEGEDRRFIHASGANAELTGREMTEAMIAGSRILYVGGIGMNPALSGENVAKLFTIARRLGVKTVLDVVVSDPEAMSDMLAPVLPVTDVFLPNSDEAHLITGLNDAIAQAAHFRHLGAQTVIITRGPGGANVLSAASPPLRMHAHHVTQLDGTGGGDAFTAGYLFGLLEDAPLQRCLEYGAALGAACVQTAGATTWALSADELRRQVAERPIRIDVASR